MYEKVTKETMVMKYFGCEARDIADTVILTPIWNLDGFRSKAAGLVKEFEGWYKGITLEYNNKRVTIISSGIGSPLSGDCALALGYTDCSHVLFSGSAGAINGDYSIGDLLAVSEAVIGEGFSRYHCGGIRQDCFGRLVHGDRQTAKKLLDTIKINESRYGIKCWEGRIFTIDSILGERKDTFEFMKEKGCDAVEMEVSSIFTACSRIGKKAAAMILISDLPLAYRNLFEGITEADIARYNEIKHNLPEILLEAAASL